MGLGRIVAAMKEEKARKRAEAEIFLASRPQIGAFRIIEDPSMERMTIVRTHGHHALENSAPHKPKTAGRVLPKLDYRSYQNSRDNSTEK